MRQVLLCVSILLLGLTWSFAQTSGSSEASPSGSGASQSAGAHSGASGQMGQSTASGHTTVEGASIMAGISIVWSFLRAVSYALLLIAVFAGRSSSPPVSTPH